MMIRSGTVHHFQPCPQMTSGRLWPLQVRGYLNVSAEDRQPSILIPHGLGLALASLMVGQQTLRVGLHACADD
jgi:hypothetical protein